MDYRQTDIKNFIETFHLFNQRLPGELITKSYISIGSNFFIKFGEEFDDKFPNGRPYKRSPWTIWTGSNVDWRLSKNDEFIVGSCQSYDQMNADVQELVGKNIYLAPLFLH